MTPKDRLGAFLTGQPIDRIPVIPLVLNQAARVAGINVRDHARDGALMGQAHVAAYRTYHQDMITVFTDTAVIAEAMGTKLYYPPDDVARVDVPVVQTHGDVDKVVDAGPYDGNGMTTYLEAVAVCGREVGEEVFTGCCFAAPFTTAACLRGTDMLARDLRRDPGLARELLARSLAVALRFVDACADAGAVPAVVDPVATGSVLSQDQFREFALPGIAALVDAIHARGLPALVHVCGKTHRLFEALADSGADIISLDVADLADAKARIGDRATLMGNVRPAETMLGGTPEEVEAEVIECLRKAGDSPKGFILSSGCEVPLESAPENVHAMIAACEKWGRLPLALPQ